MQGTSLESRLTAFFATNHPTEKVVGKPESPEVWTPKPRPRSLHWLVIYPDNRTPDIDSLEQGRVGWKTWER